MARAQIVALIVIAGFSAGCTSGGENPPGSRPLPANETAVFPGGGEILFSDARGLSSISSDGSERHVGLYLGAEPTPSGDGLLAWRGRNEDNDYFVTELDGGHPNLLLRHTGRSLFFDVQVSPDGRAIAYGRQTYVGPGKLRFELLVMYVRTGRRIDLGPARPAGHHADFQYKFAWNHDSRLLLVQSDSRRRIEWLDPRSGARGTYLAVTDRRVVTAYDRASPGLPPPAEIRPIGWTSDPSYPGLATLVSRTRGSHPAVVVLGHGATRAFASPKGTTSIDFSWAQRGSRFLLGSSVASRGGYRRWQLFVGDARTGEILQVAEDAWRRASLLNPDGTVAMYQPDYRHWTFVPARRCPRSRGCERTIEMQGWPEAWAA